MRQRLAALGQGDKVLIWRKKTKDGRHDSDIFPNFLKN